MKRSTLLALMLTSISTSAFAETPAPASPAFPAGKVIGGKDYLVRGEMPTPPNGAMVHGGVGGMKDRMGRHMENVWDEMDTNKDGAISKEESAAFGARKFAERDANHDGKVTKEEWDGFRAKKMEEMRSKMGNAGGMPPVGGAAAPTTAMPATTTEKK